MPYGILSTPSTLGPSYTGAPSDRSGDTPKPPLVENHPPDDSANIRCVADAKPHPTPKGTLIQQVEGYLVGE